MHFISRILFVVACSVHFENVVSTEWSCTSATPETQGLFVCTNDCTMTSAGVALTGDINITGLPSLTTITAKASGFRRHFYFTTQTMTLKWLILTGGEVTSGSGWGGDGSQSSGWGGSIEINGGGTLHASYCSFVHNKCNFGGTLNGQSGSSIQLYHTNITDSTSPGGRGGDLTEKSF